MEALYLVCGTHRPQLVRDPLGSMSYPIYYATFDHMTNRHDSRSALLAHATRDLAKLEAEYQASLQARSIDAALRVDIKNLFENLRSVLDYLAQDIRAKYCPPQKPGERFYFPILPDHQQFVAKMKQWFPDLESRARPLYDYLGSIQPYQGSFEWLGQFNRVNNENKHANLLEQTRIETQQVRATRPGGGSVSWNPGGARFGDGVSIMGVPVDPATQMPVPDPSLKVERITWVDFHFAGIGVSALALMRASTSGIVAIVAEVERYL